MVLALQVNTQIYRSIRVPMIETCRPMVLALLMSAWIYKSTHLPICPDLFIHVLAGRCTLL